jgi:hypothetical protein
VEFRSAVESFQRETHLLETTPEANQAAERVRLATSSLADAIEHMPASQDVDVVDAARAIRSRLSENVDGAQGSPATATAELRDALGSAAGVMAALARGPYARAPHVAERVASFERAVKDFAPDASVLEPLGSAMDALIRAGEALWAFELASGIVPAPLANETVRRAPTNETLEPGATGAQAGESALATFVTYSALVDRVASAPPDEVTKPLGQALHALADALEAVPVPRESPLRAAPTKVASEVRVRAAEFTAAPGLSAATTALVKSTFELTANFFADLTRRSSNNAGALEQPLEALQTAQAHLDPRRSLRAQLAETVRGLDAAESALRTSLAHESGW